MDNLSTTTEKEFKRFSDFAQDKVGLVGDKKTIAEILNKEILVTGYRILEGKYPVGKALLHLQFKYNDIYYTVFTNGTVLLKQIKQYEKEIPFYATIKKLGNYYTFQ